LETWSTRPGGLGVSPLLRHPRTPLTLFYHRNGISQPAPAARGYAQAPVGLKAISYQVALKRLFSVRAGFSLRLHRLESLCHLLTAIWYQVTAATPAGAPFPETQSRLTPPGPRGNMSTNVAILPINCNELKLQLYALTIALPLVQNPPRLPLTA